MLVQSLPDGAGGRRQPYPMWLIYKLTWFFNEVPTGTENNRILFLVAREGMKKNSGASRRLSWLPIGSLLRVGGLGGYFVCNLKSRHEGARQQNARNGGLSCWHARMPRNALSAFRQIRLRRIADPPTTFKPNGQTSHVQWCILSFSYHTVYTLSYSNM